MFLLGKNVLIMVSLSTEHLVESNFRSLSINYQENIMEKDEK